MLSKIKAITRRAWSLYKNRIRYPHRCHYCKYLGRYKEFDLYYCDTNHHSDPIFGGTLVARNGWFEKHTAMSYDMWVMNRVNIVDHLPELEAAYQKARPLVEGTRR